MSEPKDPSKPSNPKVAPRVAGREASPRSVGKELGGDLDFEPDLLLDSLLEDDELPKAPASIPGPKLHEPASRSYPADEITMVGHPEDIARAKSKQTALNGDDVDELLENGDWEEKTNIMGGGSSPLNEAIKEIQDQAARDARRASLPSIEATRKPPAVNPSGPARREPFLEAASPRVPNARISPAEQQSTPNMRFSAVNNDSVVTSADSFLPPPPSLVISEGGEEETRIFRPAPTSSRANEPRVPPSAPMSSRANEPRMPPAAPTSSRANESRVPPTAPALSKEAPTVKRPTNLSVDESDSATRIQRAPVYTAPEEQDDETRIFRPALEKQEPPSQKSPASSATPPSSRKTPPPLPGSSGRRSPPPFPGPFGAPPQSEASRSGFTSQAPAGPRHFGASGTPNLAVTEGDSETKLHRADDLIAATRDSASLQQAGIGAGEANDEDFRPTRRPPPEMLADPFAEEESIRTPILGLSTPSSEPAPTTAASATLQAENLPNLSFGEPDEDDGLESLPPVATELRPTPPPPVASQPPALWSDERKAAAHLAEQNLTDAWSKRAEWFESEAHSATDPQAKARALLMASELWAIVGDGPRAREVATEASALTRQQSMVARQLRCLAAAEDDNKAVVAALELETRNGATPEARVHAAYLSSEVHRLLLKDGPNAKKKLDLAFRAQQDDARAHLAKLIDLLSTSNAAPRLKLPENLADLGKAVDDVAELRGAAPVASAVQTPTKAFEAARRALSSRDRARAANAIRRLSEIDGMQRSTMWLAAALLGHDAATRPEAINLLTELMNEHGSGLARRALAARALEQGDAEAVRNAILPTNSGSIPSSSPFKPGDRIALATLTGVDPALLETELTQLSHDHELRPLAAATIAAAPNPEARREILCGASTNQSELRLGRTLAQAKSSSVGRLEWLKPAAEAFAETHADHPLRRALALEFGAVLQTHASVAQAFADWPGAAPERDRKLAAGLISEFSGDEKQAASAYRSALAEQSNFESAVRVLIAKEDSKQAADRLIELSNVLGESPRSALLLTEAALRLGSDDTPSYETLLKRAIENDPSLFVAIRLGEQQARRRGDAEQLLEWLKARRDTSSDPIEKALDQVREALLIADSDAEAAASLLEEAVHARPTDIGLRELAERLTGSRERDRASWREQVAASAEGGSKEALLIQAALEHERAGDLEAAARAGFAAAEIQKNAAARVLAERNALRGPSGTLFSDTLLTQARAAEHPEQARALYTRLGEIDRARGDTSSALLWQTAILEKSPQHLPALRHIEHAFISTDRGDELEAVAATLATLLGADESNAHARLAARLRIKSGAWNQARELALLASKQETPRLWALRLLSALGRATDDLDSMLQADRRLYELTNRTSDKATLALRAAEASTRLGKLEDARQLLDQSLELIPDHLVSLHALAEVLEAIEDYRGAAKALEAAAEASSVTQHKVNAWHSAAVMWLDKLNESERGRLALEQAVTLDTTHEDTVLRLQTLYVAAGERQKLAALLERRIENSSDPEERVALEVARGRALAEVGERDAAKAALAAALDGNPDHVEALEALADLCAAEGDWTSAEQAWIRLARHVIEPERQAQIYRKLGELYDTALPNPQRAELAYREVLKRDSNDTGTVARLIQVYAQLGDTATAVALQTELLNRARTPEEKRDRTLQLAIVEEQINRDRRRAEAILEKARKDWPLDGQVLRALAEFHVRGGDPRPAQVLVERAAADARRALATGRFEASFFEILGAVAEFKNLPDAALVSQATLGALYGDEIGVKGAGLSAGTTTLDDLLAPDVLSTALRSLLRKTGEVLDTAYPVDLKAMRAVAMPSGASFNIKARETGEAFGVHGLEVFVSPGLGPVCLPLSSSSPQIVLGPALLDSGDEAARFFLLVRAVKLIQAKASTLSRTAPIELGSVISAHLAQFAPTFSPTGVDAKKFSEAKQRIANSLVRHKVDADVPTLALEVIGAIGNRMSQIATALHQWGNRTALLAIGDPVAALRAIALAGGHGSPPEGAERIKWIGRNAEARDLMMFSVSDHYSQARQRLGLTEQS